MAKNFRQPGKSIEITGQATTIAQGSIFRRLASNAARGDRGWIGVVTDEIIGTSADAETLDGRPIQIGDGVAAEAQSGDGKGDMMIEGVFTFALPTSGMVIYDTNPVYGNFPATGGAPTAATTLVASGVTNNQNASFARLALSGALVGFAVGANYTSTVAPYTGMNVVDVKLLGNALHGLDGVAVCSNELPAS